MSRRSTFDMQHLAWPRSANHSRARCRVILSAVSAHPSDLRKKDTACRKGGSGLLRKPSSAFTSGYSVNLYRAGQASRGARTTPRGTGIAIPLRLADDGIFNQPPTPSPAQPQGQQLESRAEPSPRRTRCVRSVLPLLEGDRIPDRDGTQGASARHVTWRRPRDDMSKGARIYEVPPCRFSVDGNPV